MKKYLLFIVLFTLGSSMSFAQSVEIGMDDVPSQVGLIYENIMLKGEAIPVNVGPAGENQVWDLTTLDMSNAATRTWEVVEPANSPFNGDFPDANLVYKVTASDHDTVTFNYVRLTESDLSQLGQGKQLSGAPVFLATPHFIDPWTTFPVKWGDAPWISMPQYASSVKYLGIQVDVIATDSSYYELDGWGTLKTQLGEIKCLRVKQTNSRHVFIKQLNLTIKNITRYIIYNWVADKYGFIASIKSKNKEENVNFTEATDVTIMSIFKAVSVAANHDQYKIKEFSLHQNYPNPFNPVTTISYSLPQASWIKVNIVNATGQEVMILTNEKQDAGNHTVNWNASELPSGLYFYQVNYDNVVYRKKAMLLK